MSWKDCKVISGHLFKDFNGTLPDNVESFPFEVREDGVKPIFSQLEKFDLHLLEASSDPSGLITAAYELVWQPYYADSPSWQISFRFAPNENYDPSNKDSLSYRIDAAAIGSRLENEAAPSGNGTDHAGEESSPPADYPHAEGLSRYTDEQIAQLRENFGIPDEVAITGIEGGEETYYWEGGDLWCTTISIYSGDQMISTASIEPDTLMLVRHVLAYSMADIDESRLVYLSE